MRQLEELIIKHKAEKREHEASELLWVEKRKNQEKIQRLLGLTPHPKDPPLN